MEDEPMRKILFIAAVAMVALPTAIFAADNVPSEGFTALFNGKHPHTSFRM